MASIGQGLQGTVTANKNNMVLKTTSARVAEKEQRVAEILKTIDPDQQYTIYGIQFTPINNKKVQVSMPHGGEDLDKLIAIQWLLQFGKPTEDNIKRYKNIALQFQPELPKILKKFEELIAWVPTMHAAGVTHSDLQPSNMVWDGEHLRLIDWGYATFSTEKDFEKETKSEIGGLRELFEELKQHSDFIFKKMGLQGGSKRRKTRKHKKSKKERNI